MMIAQKKMQEPNSGQSQTGLISHRVILIYSVSLTLLGIVLFRLATANTQGLIYGQIFAISGATIATVPWLAQFLVSTAVIFLYRAGVCDLTWLVKSAPAAAAGGGGIRGSTVVIEDIENRGCRVYNGKNEQGGKNAIDEGSAIVNEVPGERSGPGLQRSRTV